MARGGEAASPSFVDHRPMHARYVDGITIRPLGDGDAKTVADLFARLGAVSREQRFCGAKPRLADAELAALSRVDADHHVLVAYVDRDPRPAGMARLVRSGRSASLEPDSTASAPIRNAPCGITTIAGPRPPRFIASVNTWPGRNKP